MLRKLRTRIAALAAAPCPYGCYKKFKNGRWECVTCGN
jgi:hypothetical protein